MSEPLDEQGETNAAPEAPAPPARGGLVLAGLVLAVAVICGIAWSAARSDGDDGGGRTDTGRATTCTEWTAKGGTNKLIQAREMLTSLRAVDGLGAPETSMAQQFADGISNVCSSGRIETLSDVAAGLYLTERSTFG